MREILVPVGVSVLLGILIWATPRFVARMSQTRMSTTPPAGKGWANFV